MYGVAIAKPFDERNESTYLNPVGSSDFGSASPPFLPGSQVDMRFKKELMFTRSKAARD